MAKDKVAIVCDSVCNLPPELVAQNDIHVVPAIVNWEGASLLDGVDISTQAFYDRLRVSKELPKTSQPSPGQFAEKFEELKDRYAGIVVITVSELLSGTFASAVLGRESLPADYPIEIVDSRSASLGQGLMGLAAARMAADGKGTAEIAGYVRSLVPGMRVLFAVDTLEYLHKGGRIGGAQRLVGSMLSIKPVLHLHEGRVEPLASIRTKSKAIQHMFDVVIGEAQGKGRIHLGVIHAQAPDAAADLTERATAALSPVEVVVAELSPTIGTNVGPGTVGMGYYIEP